MTADSQGTLITGRHLGGIQFAIVIEEVHEDKAVITEHPVEQGAKINDHAYMEPAKLTIKAGHSDTEGAGASREIYEKLLELMRKREPFDIVTGKRLYQNMLIEAVSITTDLTTENALLVAADCREVIIVKVETAEVPERKAQKNPARTGKTASKGQKQAKAADASKQPAKRKSMLKGAFG